MRLLCLLVAFVAALGALADAVAPIEAQAAEESPSAKLLKEGKVLKKDEFLPPGAADFTLYKMPERTWHICGTSKTNPKDQACRIYQVSEVTAKGATVLDVACDKDGEPTSDEVKTTVIDFAKDAAKVRVAPAGKYDLVQFPDETIEVSAGIFRCYVFAFVSLAEKEPVFNSMYWMSKKYPGLQVFAEKAALTIELMSFVRDEGDKDDTNPAKERRKLPPPPKDDWSLFSKKGRKWTSKCTSEYTTTYSTFEITNVTKDYCEYKATIVDKDKKPIGEPATVKLEFNEENAAMWLRPLRGYKKLREEKLKAAGVEWDCNVYEGSLLKDQTQTLWVSKKYPGLHVKIVTKSGDVQSVDELVEFQD